jgi:hypothetical protein
MKTEKNILIDDKGVSEIIGVILIFGILVLFLGILQSVFVPEWDREIEAAHFNNIYDDTLYLRQVIQETSIFVLPRTVLVHASLDYPTRIFLNNPPKPGATISTYNDKKIRIYYNDGNYSLVNSCTIQIKENYNYFSAPELIIEHGIIMGKVGDNPYIIDGPPMNNKTINFYLVECSNNSIGTTSSINIHLLPTKSDIPIDNVSSIRFTTDYRDYWIEYLTLIKVTIGETDPDAIIIYNNSATIGINITSIKV